MVNSSDAALHITKGLLVSVNILLHFFITVLLFLLLYQTTWCVFMGPKYGFYARRSYSKFQFGLIRRRVLRSLCIIFYKGHSIAFPQRLGVPQTNAAICGEGPGAVLCPCCDAFDGVSMLCSPCNPFDGISMLCSCCDAFDGLSMLCPPCNSFDGISMLC